MVTVLGHRGYLGAVVARRWAELGETGDYVICTFDDLALVRRLAKSGPGVIVPSTDAIAEDTAYAATKREIEAIPGIVVIRAGIVDTRKRSDLINMWCNPLTPLEWADLAYTKRNRPGVHVAGGEVLTRWQIGVDVADVFGGAPPLRVSGPHDLDRVQYPHSERSLIRALVAYRKWLGERSA